MKRSLVPIVLVIAALALTGCSAASNTNLGSEAGYSTGDAGLSGGANVGAPQAQDSAGKMVSAPDPAAAATGTGTGTGTATVADRQVITNGSMTISAQDPIATIDKAVQIAEGAGGRVDARTEIAPVNGDQGSASLTLRLPSATLTSSIDKLKKLGTVESVSLTAQDVTTAVQDVDARISAMRASLDRLLALMKKATTTESLIALETAVSDRQGNLEALEAQQRYLADQVTLSTIELSLISPASAPADVPNNFFSGIVVGWNAFVSAMAGLLVILGVILPWLVIAGILAAVVVGILRGKKRRETPAPHSNDEAHSTDGAQNSETIAEKSPAIQP